jgi:hypothetical protein
MDIDRLCSLLFFEDIYRVMAVNEVKKICNAKFQKAQNSSPSILNSFLGRMAPVAWPDGSGR